MSRRDGPGSGAPRAASCRATLPPIILALACALCTGGPAPARAAAAPEIDPPIQVIVSILPQAAFVQRVAGDRVAVEVLVGPGQTPETYEPTPRQMTRLATARVYFRIGVPFESVLAPRLARGFPELRVVDLREGIELLPIDGGPSGHAHVHEPAPTPTGPRVQEGGLDPHVWLDPRLVARQLAVISRTLGELDPVHAALFEDHRERYARELTTLHAELEGMLAPYRGRRFYVYHPAFGYLAAAYGLIQVPVETAGREPTPRELAGLIDRARADRIGVLYTQPQYTARGAQAIAEVLGAQLVVLDDLAADYAANLREIGRLLAAGFAARGTP